MTGSFYKRPKPAVAAPAGHEKDIWDKISTLTVPLITLTLGLLGWHATNTYNDTSLAQQSRQFQAQENQRAADTQSDLLFRKQQSADAQTLAKAQELEKLYPYLQSSDKQKREFGYLMFDTLGHRDLALHLIHLKQDPAGVPLLKQLRLDPNPTVRAAAVAGLAELLSPRQEQAVGAAIDHVEGVAGYGAIRRFGDDLSYGRGGWGIVGGGLQRLISRYCMQPDSPTRALCKPENVFKKPVTDEQIRLLTEASCEPAMRRAQDAQKAEEYSGPARRSNALARELGLKLPLSIAIIRDTIYWMGTATKMVQYTNEEMGKTPAQGADEKAWIQTFLKMRGAHVPVANAYRNPYYQKLIDADNWQMADVK